MAGFWATKGHAVEPSVGLIAGQRSTLLWINSGVAPQNTCEHYSENPRITNAQRPFE